MRILSTSLLLLVAATGCDVYVDGTSSWGGGGTGGQFGNDQFTHSSTLYTTARGVAFDSDGAAQVGMGGNTCEIDPESGMIGTDVDVAAAEDQVVDARGGVVLVRGVDGLHTYIPDQWAADGRPDVAGADVIAGRLTDGGIAALRETVLGCVVEWRGAHTGTSAAFPGCSGAFEADPASGTAFAVGEQGIVVSGAEGSTIIASDADLIAWDAAANVLYAANSGASTLTAFERDGAVRFTVELGGLVTSLDAMGTRGEALALLDVDGAGRIVTVNGQNGEITSSLDVPDAQAEVSSSQDGGRIAVKKEWETYFFRVTR